MGPWDAYTLEKSRAEQGVRSDKALPVDYFVWARGEPEDRSATKIGGLPYLPAKRRWPRRWFTNADFYAQINFTDSKDLVPDLPGDVLLIFRFNDLWYDSWGQRLYKCVWVNVTDEELIAPDRVRRSAVSRANPWPPFHGYRVRSFDDPSHFEGDVEVAPFSPSLLVNPATKIGGVGSDMQDWMAKGMPKGYRFIAQVAALWPVVGAPYPIVDRAEPIGNHRDPEFKALSSGPGDGITCLFLGPNGDIRIHFSCA